MIIATFNASKLCAEGQVSNDVKSDKFQPFYHVDLEVTLGFPLELVHELLDVAVNEGFLGPNRFIRERVRKCATLAGMVLVRSSQEVVDIRPQASVSIPRELSCRAMTIDVIPGARSDER